MRSDRNFHASLAGSRVGGLMMALMALSPVSAWALCMGSIQYRLPSLSIPSINYDSYPLNSVIHTLQTSRINDVTHSIPEGIVCTMNEPDNYDLRGIGTAIRNDIYTTSVPNVGIRMTWGQKIPYRDRANVYFPLPPSMLQLPGGGKQYTLPRLNSSPVTLELIKLGAILPGGLLSGKIADIYVGSNPVGALSFGAPITVLPPTRPTCSVATPSVNVSLGRIALTAFTGVGSTGAQQPFELTLACSGGDSGTLSEVRITLTDVTQPTNTSTTLSLANGSTASGFGIQILRDDVPLHFGPDSSSQWLAGQVSPGQPTLSIALSARFVQTTPAARPGSANALATFTMNYQ